MISCGFVLRSKYFTKGITTERVPIDVPCCDENHLLICKKGKPCCVPTVA